MNAAWPIRFFDKIDKADSGCWLWKSILNVDGYGILMFGRKKVRAHRLAVQLSGREIPPGMSVDHLCRVRNCVNPIHLEVVDDRTNILRGVGSSAVNAKKTHCVKGHEFSEDNTYYRKDRKQGNRGCRRCRTEATYRYRRAK